jgi:hypothetical protein
MTSQPQWAIDRHIRAATRNLVQALHYHRYGYATLTNNYPQEWRDRMTESNGRTIAAYARRAGQSARYSGQLCEAWESRCPRAYAVPEIRDAFVRGWLATDRDILEVVDSPVDITDIRD